MALDDKDKKDIEVPFEGTIEIDPSSIKLEDDGSMSEPSFSSVEVIDSDDSDFSDSNIVEENISNYTEVGNDTIEELDDSNDLTDSDIDDISDNDFEDISDDDTVDEQLGDDSSDISDDSFETSSENEMIDEPDNSYEESTPNDSSEIVEESREPSETTSDEGTNKTESKNEESSSDTSTDEQSSEDTKTEETSSNDNNSEEQSSNDSTSDNDTSSESSDDNQSTDESVDEEPSSADTPVDDQSSANQSDENVSNEEPSKEDTVPDKQNEEPSTDNRTNDNQNVDNKEQPSDDKFPDDNKKQDNKEKSDKKDDSKDKKKDDLNKPDASETADKAKDAAKDKAKDAADAAKDKAKDAADAAKEQGKEAAKNAAKEGAKQGAKNAASSVSDKVDIAKNTKDAFKKGPKGLVGAPGLRAAAAASENTNQYSKIAATVIRALDAIIGRDNTDKLLDFLGGTALKLAFFPLMLGIFTWLCVIITLVIAVYMIFAPLLDSIESIDRMARNVANTAEKIRNFYVNGRYGDSKEVFYQEMNTLEELYGDDLDELLLMSTTFYPDIHNGYETHYDNIGDIVNDIVLSGDINYDGNNENAEETFFATLANIVKKEIESLDEESRSTYDEQTGLLYTTGKIYRLRQLSAHMFASDFLGDEDDYNIKEITLSKWIKRYGKNYYSIIEETCRALGAKIYSSGLEAAAGAGLVAVGAALSTSGVGAIVGIPLMILGAYLTFDAGAQWFKNIDQLESDMKILINATFLGFMSIDSIEFNDVGVDDFDFLAEFDDDGNLEAFDEDKWDDLLDNITIKYYSYKYNEENYKAYLREEYIPKNPDFEKVLNYDKDGNPTEASIERVINEIYEYRDFFDEIFMEHEYDYSENYSELCIGAIDRKLASAMSMPVDINTSRCIEFLDQNGYGYTTTGMLHNGIELNEHTTGNTEGDNVYSVMDNGTIKSSSADGTMECVGGCLEIEYSSSTGIVDKSSYQYSIVYKGLSKSSVTLSTGDVVNNRDVVGTIGTSAESENMGVSSLYLEFRKADGTAIDPTNMVVKCSSAGAGDYPGATIIDVPQSFTQTKYYTVTCLLEDGFDWGCDNVAPGIDVTSDDYPVFLLWKEQGARYKDGMAILTVDGVDRYLIAVVPTFGSPGDVLNIRTEDGSVFPAVVLDAKRTSDSNIYWIGDIPWGHSNESGTVNIVEFEVLSDAFKKDKKDNVMTSKWDIEWNSNSPVVSVSNNGNIISGSFDISANAGSGSNVGGSGLTLCESMISGGTNSNVEKYVAKAIEYANDDSIGYSQSTRYLNPNLDCSSLVFYSLFETGIINPTDTTPFVTSTMGEVLTNFGFEEIPYDVDKLKKGDIVVDPDKHTVIYIGDGKQVAANGCKPSEDHPNRSCDTSGDQDEEVSVKNFYDSSGYEYIYRLRPETVILP